MTTFCEFLTSYISIKFLNIFPASEGSAQKTPLFPLYTILTQLEIPHSLHCALTSRGRYFYPLLARVESPPLELVRAIVALVRMVAKGIVVVVVKVATEIRGGRRVAGVV